MRNNKDLGQQSFCRFCGLIVVDLVCPYCRSTIEEPVIHKSKNAYQSRLTSIIGVFLLIVAGVTPAVVSAREPIGTATIPSPTVVVSTTTSAAPVMERTSTTLSSPNVTNESNSSKNSTSQKPKMKKPSSSGTVYVAPVATTTTTLPPHASGKKRTRSQLLWKSPDSRYDIDIMVWGTSDPSQDWAAVTTSGPARFSAFDTEKCDGSKVDYVAHERLVSLDGGITTSEKYSSKILINCYDSKRGYVLSYGEFDEGRWHAGYGEPVTAPVPAFHVKLRYTFLLIGKVVESPWVLVDWSAIP
jgi:hypothetical protein